MMAWHEMYMARYLGVDVIALTEWAGAMTPAAKMAQVFGKSPTDFDKAVAYADRMTGETGTFFAAPEPEPESVSLSGLTVSEVLDAVGDDPVAARSALDEELGSDKPRSTLVAQLENILGL